MRSGDDGAKEALLKHRKTEDDEDEGGMVDGKVEEFGMRRPQRKAGPREPTKEEKEEHEKTHLPFRSWCRHCVRGRGKEEACRKVERTPEIPEVHIDFMFMGGGEGGKDVCDVGG